MPTRRDILHGTGGLAGTIGLAGCTVLSSVGLTSESGGATGPPWCSKWMPQQERGRIITFGLDVPALRGRTGLPREYRPGDLDGLPVSEVDQYAWVHGARIYAGTFERSTAVSAFESSEDITLARGDSYAGLDKFQSSAPDMTLGTKDGLAVFADARSFERIVDAGLDRSPGLLERREYAEKLMTAVGQGHFTQARVYASEDALPAGENRLGHVRSITFRDETARFTSAGYYQDPSDIDVDAQRADLESESAVSNVSVSLTGQLLEAEFTVPLSAL